MAKLSVDAKEFYKPHFKLISWVFVLCTVIPIDVIKFFVDLVPGVDLIDIVVCIATFLGINVFFFLKLGPSYMDGKKALQKTFITLSTAMVGLIPILDGFVPEETFDAVGLMLAVDQEDRLKAEDDAQETATSIQQQQINAMAHAQFVQDLQESRANQAMIDKQEEEEFAEAA